MRKLLFTIFIIWFLFAAAHAATVAVSSVQIPNWQFGGSTVKLKFYPSAQFKTSENVVIMPGSIAHGIFYKEVNCTISSNVLTIPSFTIDSTTDSDVPTVYYTAVFFDSSGTKRDIFFEPLKVPTTTPTTWGALRTFNLSPQTSLPITYYTSAQADSLLSGLSLAPNASDVVLGKSYLSVAPASASVPTAVEDNDARVTAEVFSDKYSSFSAAVSAQGLMEAKTLVVSTSESVSSNLSVPANVTLRFTNTGQLNVSSGITATINGTIDASGDKQIFSGGGTVSLVSSKISVVFPEWFGAKGDYAAPTALDTDGAGTDDRTAIEKAVAAAPQGATVQLAAKNYRVSGAALTITKQITLRGQGRGFWSSGALALTEFGTALYFDTTRHGLVLDSATGAIIEVENLTVSPANLTKVTTVARHGIWIKSRAVVRNITAVRFSGSGIYIGSSVTENANFWELTDVITANNNQHGVHLPLLTDEGGQTENNNGGTGFKIDARDNTLDGIFDESQHGNYYVGHHASYNGRYGFHTLSAGTQDSVFLGGYEEGNGAGSFLCEGSQSGTMVLGGTHSPDGAGAGNGAFFRKILPGNVWSIKLRDTNANQHIDIRPSEIQQTFLGGRNRYITVPGVATMQEFLTAAGVWQMKTSADNVFLSADINAATGNAVLQIPYGTQTGTNGTIITKVLRGTLSVDPASIAAGAVSSQTFTLTGAAVGDSLTLNVPAAGLTAGLLVHQSRVSAANQITITFQNTTAGAINEASAGWTYLLTR